MTKGLLVLAIPFGCLAIVSCSSPPKLEISPTTALKTAASVYLQTSRELSPEQGYPRSIPDETGWEQGGAGSWTSGFFPGILWQLYDYTQDEAFLEQARRWTEGLENQKTAPTHDVGFMINNSFGRGYRSAGIAQYKAVALEAAKHLALRFNARVGAIKAWDERPKLTYPVIIDTMMNLELLFWAARNGGDPSLASIAKAHAMTTLQNHVRDDGSTFHVVDYQPQTGQILWRGTIQGLADGSTWARGQAWGIYGFAAAYRETRDPLFLETARRLADRFIERLPRDGIPYWDFDAPAKPSEPKDASAAAIAASGLWELAMLVEDAAAGRRYRAASRDLIKRLSSLEYFAPWSGLPALLLHSTGNKLRARDVDVPLIYADYYFLEALIKGAPGCAGIDESKAYP